MPIDVKANINLIERRVHSELSPLGFKKHKLVWRRTSALIHQFALVSMQLGNRYQASWGLHVSSFDENPKPQPHRLHVQWFWAELLSTPGEREQFFKTFDPTSDMDSLSREHAVSEAIRTQVLPCFTGLLTDTDVRAMMSDLHYPRRAHQFYGLPDEWWPPQ